MTSATLSPKPADTQARVPSENILTPRFYTTDFEAIARMDIGGSAAEFEAMLKEFRTDYNQHHFVRGSEFEQSWDHLDPEVRRLFVEFLERSCTAEFSGFLLYKELSRKLKQSSPVLAECFNLMSRDEARHAGFLNRAMSDFDLALDLGFLTKNKSYTYFAPRFIFYATYLSEKIGYWRYILIYRHLEAHPEHRVYPIFNFFKNWCQDESRHGDFFSLMLSSQPKLLRGLAAHLWCRFFLLSVFATMYLNDVAERPEFYQLLGLDPKTYDLEVIRKTNADAGKVFPVVLHVEHPEFVAALDRCVANNHRLRAIARGEGSLKTLRKLPFYAANALEFLRLFLIKPLPSPITRRMQQTPSAAAVGQPALG
ncbi:MAG: magnesium-protoporphyrin IX monomethyl ester (oxidative) cyclase [Cyanobacteriota bacterium]|nr:magnesium-protoporphyrin IX monomethyl ester (oxidative) cyclase [Cyanobacteriota bacterium]